MDQLDTNSTSPLDALGLAILCWSAKVTPFPSMQWMAGAIPMPAVVAMLRVLCSALAFVLGGCAVLPDEAPRTPSYAHADVADTQLARTAQSSTPEGKRSLSGFRLLPDGEEAFQTRIALIRRAERTIDVQYYLIASDRTGLQFLRELRDAAARGVRVRVLVDDLYAAGEDATFAALAIEPHAEVHIFNPLPERRGTFAARLLLSMHELSRVNHRMHNKLFVVDNAFAIVGGRNIADEYFDRGSSANFIDTDVLVSGPIISQLSSVFDNYWNSRQATPLCDLAPIQELVTFGALGVAGPTVDDVSQTGVVRELENGSVTSDYATADVVADAPSKAAGEAIEGEGAPALATQALFSQARRSILVSSPYVIPGTLTLDALRTAHRADVAVRFFTNSMLSTDEPMVFAGYAKFRPTLTSLGVDLYELADRSAVTGPNGTKQQLHAKLAVVDSRWVTVGSMNMDRRSAICNTEMIMVIDNVQLAQQVSNLIETRLSHSVRVSSNSAAATPQRASIGKASLGVRLAASLVGDKRL